MQHSIKQIREAAKDLGLAKKIDRYMEQWESDSSISYGSDINLAMQINEEYEKTNNLKGKGDCITEVDKSHVIVPELGVNEDC